MRANNSNDARLSARRIIISRVNSSSIHIGHSLFHRRRELRTFQLKDGDLGPHIEADPTQVTEAPINVEPAAVAEVDFPGCVQRISYRQQWRRQEGRLTLPAVRVTREDPTSIA